MNMSFTVEVYETGFSDDEPEKAYDKRGRQREKKENKMREKYQRRENDVVAKLSRKSM